MPLREHHRASAEALGRAAAETTAADRPGAASGALAGGEPEYVQWGDGATDHPDFILATIGSVELEYAALRRGVGLIDAAHREVIEVRGADAKDLIGRLVTQKIAGKAPMQTCDAFLLERTGRILADLTVLVDEDGVMVSVDRCDCSAVVEAIESMVFTEDVRVEPPGLWATIDAHGPEVPELLEAAGVDVPDEGAAAKAMVADAACVLLRDDRFGETGVRVLAPRSDVLGVWQALHASAAGVCRTVGWYATNMARLEAAEPWWHIDFGPTNLPHETGLLHRRVSFTKGCYPGQEVVARMEHLGHPKQIVRALAMPDERLPIAGGQVFAAGCDGPGDPVGVVTSSAPSPLRGGNATALATLRWSAADIGAAVSVSAEGAFVDVEVSEASRSMRS
ncbi:MAG: hypothetical protein QF733_00350 [Phycisphaerales bacterium]|jgi:folate-binding protein YgfZ|nr:hypothetical protein [Phycisphaerales bacterium]